MEQNGSTICIYKHHSFCVLLYRSNFYYVDKIIILFLHFIKFKLIHRFDYEALRLYVCIVTNTNVTEGHRLLPGHNKQYFLKLVDLSEGRKKLMGNHL